MIAQAGAGRTVFVAQNTGGDTPPVCTPQASDVEAQLAQILASAEFRRSERMCRFLRLVTREALTGNGENLKEYRIGTEVFDKECSFDPRLDPIVRNEARRLRRKLETYYLTEGKTASLRIELPKGTYRPVFTPGVPAARDPKSHRRKRIFVAGGSLAAAAICWWLLPSRPIRSTPTPQSVTSGNTEAREKYLFGYRELLNLRIGDITASRSDLEAALRSDPKFADAYAALALNYQVARQLGLISGEAAVQKSGELCRRATELAPGSTATELALGGDDALLKGNYASAERHFQRSLEVDRNNALAHAFYSVACLLPLGRAKEAREEALKASATDPVSQVAAYALVLTAYCTRDYGTAISTAHKALQLEADSDGVARVMIDAYLFSRRFDEAWFYVEKQGFDRGPVGDWYRARIRAIQGKKDDALRLGRQWASAQADPLSVAELFAAGGDVASTMHYLKEADRQHNAFARIFVRYGPALDPMRSSAEFDAVLTK
jgi:tetratricopeptide (TPR) repeat protein